MSQPTPVVTKVSPSLSIYQLDPPGPTLIDKVSASFGNGEQTPPRPSASSSSVAEWMMHDSLAMRREVFTVEQASDWALEVDADDARSWHFSAYEKNSQAPTTNGDNHHSTGPSGEKEDLYSARPLATLRLVPGPHAAHPAPGSEDGAGGGWPDGTERTGGHRDVRTGMHDGRERYVKLGRLVTLKAARGRGLASGLIGAALDYAVANAEKLDAAKGDGGAEEDGDGESGVGGTWLGLVLVHAQTDVGPMYARNGFVEDPGLGSWMEGGIPHIGMWKRVKIPGRS